MSSVRRASADEAHAIAELWLASRRAAPIPPTIRPDAQICDWIAEILLPSCEVWVASDGEVPVAMMALSDGWVEQLYVAPLHQRLGHGKRLIELAQSEQGSLALWTFTSNHPAQRFYEEHGFTRSGAVSFDNEEQAPAILYRWRRSA